MANKSITSEKPFEIRRGTVDSVNIYEVKENELEILEKGEENNIKLNFSIFLYSIAFSSILALSTATFKFQLVETLFIVFGVGGIIAGTYLIIIWKNGRKSIKETVKIIKERIPPKYSENSKNVEKPTTKMRRTKFNEAPSG